VIPEETPVKKNWPKSHQGNFLFKFGTIAFPILAVSLVVLGGTWWWVRKTKKEKLRVMDSLPIPRKLYWESLRLPSGSTLGDEDGDDDETGAVTEFPGRHRNLANAAKQSLLTLS